MFLELSTPFIKLKCAYRFSYLQRYIWLFPRELSESLYFSQAFLISYIFDRLSIFVSSVIFSYFSPVKYKLLLGSSLEKDISVLP